jgi:hypothetical protein
MFVIKSRFPSNLTLKSPKKYHILHVELIEYTSYLLMRTILLIVTFTLGWDLHVYKNNDSRKIPWET